MVVPCERSGSRTFFFFIYFFFFFNFFFILLFKKDMVHVPTPRLLRNEAKECTSWVSVWLQEVQQELYGMCQPFYDSPPLYFKSNNETPPPGLQRPTSALSGRLALPHILLPSRARASLLSSRLVHSDSRHSARISLIFVYQSWITITMPKRE